MSVRDIRSDVISSNRGNQTIANLGFLSRLSLYETVKPYGMRYQQDKEFAQTNIKGEKVPTVVRNSFGVEDFDFERGFGLIPCPSQMSYSDFEHLDKVKSIYAKEVGDAVKSCLKARHVYVMDFSVRRRHPSYPISTGSDYEHTQPASIAHVDFTPDAAILLIKAVYGERSEEVLSRPWAIVNVWRPLRNPVIDWPLAICDPHSMDWERDSMPGDVVYSNWLTENQLIIHSPTQLWYYFPGQTPDQLLVFRGVDSRKGLNPACPHVAFANPLAQKDQPMRESIDSRVIVIFGADGDVPPEVGEVYGSKDLA
ncbi:hypothetical protein V8F33_013852 [Rhypophila sp. PSN 637]